MGSGSGYLTACMAHMLGEKGRVVGIEHIPELVKLATKNINQDNPALLASERIKLVGAYITKTIFKILPRQYQPQSAELQQY